jgi:predicted alpha/beta superfamily hydrolase
MDEYTLTKDERLGHGGRGLDYIRFIAEELKPFIDRTYRTEVDRESTMIGGSSLGGLIAMHACLEKPEVFGKCLAFSPTLGWDQEELLQSFHNGTKWPVNVRLWFSMGTREGRDSETQKVTRTRAERVGIRRTRQASPLRRRAGRTGVFARRAVDAHRIADTDFVCAHSALRARASRSREPCGASA